MWGRLAGLALALVATGATAQPIRPSIRLPPQPTNPSSSTPPATGQPAQGQGGAPVGLAVACVTFEYLDANGARNMGIRLLNGGQQFVLQPDGATIQVRTDYPSPNVPQTNVAAVFDLLREAWSARRAATLGISSQQMLTGVNVQVGGQAQCG